MGKLDPRFTFENLVVGPSNRLASAAARRAAERPGVSYNPLFIYAPSGLGKTHILGAMARHVAKVYPDKEVEYQTAQEFLREFVQAPGEKSPDMVRQRYERLDILLIDDVQYLTAQTDVQDLLLLTLDTLTGDGKQVALASDRPPAEIDGLAAHLRTRFEGGLLVSVGPPEYESRVAIVRKGIESRNQVLQPGVPDAIGRFPFQTVTDLQAALDRVLEAQESEGRIVSPEEAAAIVERGAQDSSGFVDTELGQFLDELSDTVAAKVQAQEAPWRKVIRELAEEVEEEEFIADRLRRFIEGDVPPRDLNALTKDFREIIERLKEIKEELHAAGNPWPEAAFGVLRDPDRIEEAEALLASAKERARDFPEIPPGPLLEGLGGEIPQLVIRAADQLVRTDRPEYNPLYVWSSDGASARALLQAAGRTKLEGAGERLVAYTSVPGFAEEFIHSLSVGIAGAWRERWWSADLLLVDGAQNLSDTERAQEEFFHLFEALQRRQARIMVAADRPPAEIPAIDDRLRARLEGGLVIEVEVAAEELSLVLQQALDSPVAETSVAKPEDKRIAHEDREWIRSFRPSARGGIGASVGPGRNQDEEVLDVPETVEDVEVPEQIWVPSPEQVVWAWPHQDDRICEEVG